MSDATLVSTGTPAVVPSPVVNGSATQPNFQTLDARRAKRVLPTVNGTSAEDSSGFGALQQACEGMIGSAKSQMGVSNASETNSGLQLQYNLAVELMARLETDWTVVDGFKLSGITLNLAANLATGQNPSLEIMLGADGTIGDIDFWVSARIPHLQKDAPVKIEFRLTLRSRVKADDLWKKIQGVSGNSTGAAPSEMVDDSLKTSLDQPLWQADLALAFVKLVDGGFSFSYCIFRLGGQINYEPKIDYPKIKVVDGSLSFALIEQRGLDGTSQYKALAELYGRIFISEARLSVCVTFQRINKIINVRLSIWNTAPLSALPLERISADTFYGNLLTGAPSGSADEADEAESVLGLLSLPASKGLEILKGDLKKPNVEFALSVDVGSKGLNQLFFQVYARKICSIDADFLKGCTIRDLVVTIDWKPRNKTRLLMLGGTLEINTWRFSAALHYQSRKEQSFLALKANLDRTTGGNCSLVELAKDSMFNADDSGDNKKEGNEKTDLARYIDKNTVPADSGLSLGLAKMNGAAVDVSFEMLLAKTADKPSAGGDPKSDKSNSDSNSALQPKVNGDVKADDTPKASSGLSGYQLEMVNFRAHFALSWILIPDHLVLEQMGLAFDLYSPKTDKRNISGFIYGEWTIEKYTLWTYILGQQNADGSAVTIGLNIKNKRNGQTSNTLASVLADPKLADSVGMPDLQLHPDIKASPHKQDLSSGLQVDGHLRIKLLKQAAVDKEKQTKWQMKELMARIDLEAEFILFGSNALANGYIDLRIQDPLEKKTRKIDCNVVGYLQAGNLRILIASAIKINSSQAKQIEGTSDKSDAVKDAEKDIDEDNTVKKPPIPVEDKEDIRFKAVVSYVKGQSKETSVNDVVTTLSPSNSVTADDDKFVPADLGISAEGFARSFNFSLNLHVGKKAAEDKRSIKSLVLTVAAKGQWDIIDKVLALKDAGLRLMILESQTDKPKQKVFMAYGTIVLLDSAAEAATAVFYENEVLSFAIVLTISLKKLINAFSGSNINGDGSSNDAPALITDQDKAGVVASVVCQVKDKKFDSFNVQIRSVGDIPIADTFIIDKCLIAVSKAAGAKEKTWGLSGTLNWGQSESRQSLTASATFEQKKITVNFALNKAPGKMLDDFLGKDAPDKDKRPELPKAVGFNDWDSDKYSTIDKTTMSSQLVFEQQDGSAGRKFESIAFMLKMGKDQKWSLIDNWIWFTDLRFKLLYTVSKKTLIVQLLVTLHFMSRQSTGDSDSQKQGKKEQTMDVILEASKEELALKLDSSSFPNCNTTDLVYALTAGIFDVPHSLGIPIFPRIGATLSWKKEEASINGFFTGEGQSWEFLGKFGSILRMENPKLGGTIPFGKSKTKAAASVSGEAVLFSKIRISIEYILPKGPLLVEGCDVQKIAEMVKKIWEKVKQLYKTLKKLSELAEGIGSFIASALTAAEGIFDGLVVAGGILGGLLGGPLWEKAKKEMIDAFKKLFDTDGEKKEAEEGMRKGAKAHEKQDVARTDLDDKRDNPKQPIDPDTGLPKEPSPRDGLVLSGTGSASGVCNEPVELFVTPPVAANTPVDADPESYNISFRLNDKPIATKSAVAGFPVRWAYRRPATAADFTITISAKGSTAALLTATLQLAAVSSRSASIAEPKSTVLLPPNISAGVPFSATLVLKDKFGNVIDGYDDRKLLVLNLDADSHPRVYLRRNAYRLVFPSMKKGKHTFAAKVDGRQICQFEIDAVAKFNPKTVSLHGLGLCSGIMGESVNILIRTLDFDENVLSDAGVLITLISDGIQTAVETMYSEQDEAYIGTYARPKKYGEYTVIIMVNGENINGSPFKLKAHEYFDISQTQISVIDPAPGKPTQTAIIETFDYIGSRWRMSSSTFAGAKLICKAAAGGDPIEYTNLVDRKDGTYQVEVQLQRASLYFFTLSLPDGRISSVNKVEVPDRTIATSLFASGDGLQTGYEGTTACIKLSGYNSEGAAALLSKSNLVVTVTQMIKGEAKALDFEIRDSRIFYTRPKTDMLEDYVGTIADASHVYVRIFYGTVEAYGSPFHVLTIPYFADISPERCEVVQLPAIIERTASSPAVGLVLVDNFKRMMTEEIPLKVKKVIDGQLAMINYHPSGIYIVEYQSSAPSVSFELSLNGKKLPPTDISSIVTFSLSDEAHVNMFVTTLQASDPAALDADKFECLAYPWSINDPGVKPEYLLLKETEVDPAGRRIIFNGPPDSRTWYLLRNKWYGVRAKYKYLPLESSSTPESLDKPRAMPEAPKDPPPRVVLSHKDAPDGDSEDEPPADNTGQKPGR